MTDDLVETLIASEVKEIAQRTLDKEQTIHSVHDLADDYTDCMVTLLVKEITQGTMGEEGELIRDTEMVGVEMLDLEISQTVK